MTSIANPKTIGQRVAWIKLGSILFILGLCRVLPAMAGCAFSSGNVLGVATATLPQSLSVPRDAAIGTAIYDSGWVMTPATRVSCTGQIDMTRGYTSVMVAVPGQTAVYQTGIPGVGINMAWVNTFASPDTWAETQLWPQFSQSISGSSYGPMGGYRVKLLITGQVSAGNLNLPTVLGNASYGGLKVNELHLTNNTALLVAPACTVQNSPIAVSMPKANVSQLPSVGSTTGDTGFIISFNCPTSVSMSITFTDAVAPDNRSNVMTLSKTSTASGVGYQILFNTTVISFGPDSSVAGTTNQFTINKAAPAGLTTVPMTARYIRTGPITPGSANANATFTMSYQ